MSQSFKEPAFYHPSWRAIVYWSFALIAAIAAFFLVRRLTACWQLTALPGLPPSYCSEEPSNPSGLPDPYDVNLPAEPMLPEVSAPAMEIPRWDGGSRINIAFFGLRGGDAGGEDCPACTDTIILLTVDPVTKTAGMFSIPRDIWVNIPGYGYSRINTA